MPFPVPSVQSVETDDRKQFQHLNIGLNNNKFDNYFWNSIDARTRFSKWRDIANPLTIFTESTFAFLLKRDDTDSLSVQFILFLMIFEYRSMFIVSV